MKINELILELEDLKDEFGNVDVIGADSYEIDFVRPQRYIQMTNPYNDIINRETEDLDEDYLERYENDKEYSKRILFKGICVKVY
jgi:hypothetical protein